MAALCHNRYYYTKSNEIPGAILLFEIKALNLQQHTYHASRKNSALRVSFSFL
jgi:hypothetical protein